MRVHLIDGTYELFRHHFGQPAHQSADGAEVAATRGVVTSVLAMVEEGATHVGVATDHVVESFRNDLWPGYKTGEGMPTELLSQFGLLEEALTLAGVVVWPMTDLEADDALASAAASAAALEAVDKVIICTPDKDLAQCVRGTRVVQLNRRTGVESDEAAIRERYGIGPASIPDWLALVGDSADGFPGIPGWGKRTASLVLGHYAHLSAIPASAADWPVPLAKSVRGASELARRLAEEIEAAYLFLDLATLRTEPPLFVSIDELAWTGPAEGFAALCRRLGSPGLAERAERLAQSRRGR
jgi:5'-3' exonuclease